MTLGGYGSDLIVCICGCYKRRWEEGKELQGKKRVESHKEMLDILVEMGGLANDILHIDGSCDCILDVS